MQAARGRRLQVAYDSSQRRQSDRRPAQVRLIHLTRAAGADRLERRPHHPLRAQPPMNNRVSRYPIPELDQLPFDIRDRMLQVQEKAGFIPNVFLTLAHRPDEFRAFFAYHDALMLRQSGLSKAEKE